MFLKALHMYSFNTVTAPKHMSIQKYRDSFRFTSLLFDGERAALLPAVGANRPWLRCFGCREWGMGKGEEGGARDALRRRQRETRIDASFSSLSKSRRFRSQRRRGQNPQLRRLHLRIQFFSAGWLL